MSIPFASTLYPTPVCGDLIDDGLHILVGDAHTRLEMVRIAKRSSLEIWGASLHKCADDAVVSTPIMSHLFWLVDIHQHDGCLTGYIVTVARIYSGDYHAMRQLLHVFRTKAD